MFIPSPTHLSIRSSEWEHSNSPCPNNCHFAACSGGSPTACTSHSIHRYRSTCAPAHRCHFATTHSSNHHACHRSSPACYRPCPSRRCRSCNRKPTCSQRQHCGHSATYHLHSCPSGCPWWCSIANRAACPHPGDGTRFPPGHRGRYRISRWLPRRTWSESVRQQRPDSNCSPTQLPWA